VELEGEHAVAEVDQAGAGVPLDDLIFIARGFQDQEIARLKPSRYVLRRFW
jgi:hypothetical protein